MYRRTTVAATLALSILVLISLVAYVETQTMDIVWVKRGNYSSFDDKPYATCLIGDYIYVVGYDKNEFNARFRVEKRSKFDGSLVKVWTYNPSSLLDDILMDCVVIGDKLYVVGVKQMFATYSGFEMGKLVVAVLDKDLNLLKMDEGPDNTCGYSIESDGKYIYVGGIKRVGIYFRWYVEKRDLNLTLVASRSITFKYDDVSDYLYSLRYNQVTDSLWAIGSIDAIWGVAILDKNLNISKVITSDLGGSAQSVTFDDNGYAYVAGIGVQSDRTVIGLVKYTPYGVEVGRMQGYYGSKAVHVNGDLYILYANPDKHVAYVFDKQLRLQKTLTLNDSTGCRSSDTLGRVSTDGMTVFFTSTICREISTFVEDSEWVIYAFTPLTKRYFFTITITTTLTKATTYVITKVLTTTSILTQQITTTMYIPTEVTMISSIYTTIPTTIVLTNTSTTTIVLTRTLTIPITYTAVTTITVTTSTNTEPQTITSYVIQTYRETITKTTTLTIILRETVTLNKTSFTKFIDGDLEKSITIVPIILGLTFTLLYLLILRKPQR